MKVTECERPVAVLPMKWQTVRARTSVSKVSVVV